MTSSKRAASILEEAGFTPIRVPDKDCTRVFITNKVCWSKLFSTLRTIPELKEGLESVPHVKWLESIIIKYNPEIEPVELENGKIAYGVRFQPVIDKNGKVPHVDRGLYIIFYTAMMYLEAVSAMLD